MKQALYGMDMAILAFELGEKHLGKAWEFDLETPPMRAVYQTSIVPKDHHYVLIPVGDFRESFRKVELGVELEKAFAQVVPAGLPGQEHLIRTKMLREHKKGLVDLCACIASKSLMHAVEQLELTDTEYAALWDALRKPMVTQLEADAIGKKIAQSISETIPAAIAEISAKKIAETLPETIADAYGHQTAGVVAFLHAWRHLESLYREKLQETEKQKEEFSLLRNNYGLIACLLGTGKIDEVQIRYADQKLPGFRDLQSVIPQLAAEENSRLQRAMEMASKC